MKVEVIKFPKPIKNWNVLTVKPVYMSNKLVSGCPNLKYATAEIIKTGGIKTPSGTL